MSYRTSFLLLTGLMPIFCSCHDNNRFEWKVAQKHMEVSLNKESDSLYVIHLDTDRPSHSTWKLPYPVYQFDYGDITGNGVPEIIVGVIKPTRFDPKPDKRLFIYRIADEAYIRPLWLGSRVAQPFEDFRIIREETPTRIRTLERERSGNFLVAEYIWRGFGLDFKRYLKREVKKQEAIHILKH